MDDVAERRRHPRVPLQTLKASLVDAYSGEALGTVADLSSGGLMLYASRGIETGSTLQTRLDWQDPQAGSHGALAIGITAQWTVPATQADTCWCGFQIIDISDEDQQALDALIAAETD